MFDAQSFLDMQVTETNSTKKTPCPIGDWQAIADKVDVRSWVKKDDPTVCGLALDIQWSIEDQSVKAALEKDKVIVKQGIMLDLTDTGGLDMGKGKNIGLGRLREAIGCNQPGQSFSFSMITGRMAKVKVSHRLADTVGADGAPDVFDEIKAVAPL